MITVENATLQLLSLYKETVDEYEKQLDLSIKTFKQSKRIKDKLTDLSYNAYNMKMTSKDFEDILIYIKTGVKQ